MGLWEVWESKPTLGVRLFGLRIASCGTSAAATFVIATRSLVRLGVANGPLTLEMSC